MNKLCGTTKGKDRAWIGDHWGTHGFGYCPAPREMGSVKFWALVVLLRWLSIWDSSSPSRDTADNSGDKKVSTDNIENLGKFPNDASIRSNFCSCHKIFQLLLPSYFFVARKKHNCCDLHLFKSELLVRLTSRKSFFASYDFYQII